jgi:ParB family transcriptional regulator, chromosome partitioning protein
MMRCYQNFESLRVVGLRVTGSEIGRVAPGARHGEDLMAQAAQKITLSSSRDIPFDKLVLSQSNVRRIKAGVSVEELAEDITRRSLLQGLSVRPVLDADGVETRKFEIPAGGQRFQAQSLQVKRKRLAKTAHVPCVLRDATSFWQKMTPWLRTCGALPCTRSISSAPLLL